MSNMNGFIFIEILISSVIILSIIIGLLTLQYKINHMINNTRLKVNNLIEQANQYELNYVCR